MSKLGKFLLALFVALPLAALGFVVAMRWIAPEPALMAALATMQSPVPPVQGRDASDAVWLLDYDLPTDAKSEAEAAANIRGYEAARALPGPFIPGKRLDPRASWRKFPDPPAEGEGVCSMTKPGCLAYVQANRALVAETIAARNAALAKALSFTEHDGLRIGVLPSLSTELPRLGGQRRLVLSYFATQFVFGEHEGAIGGLCRDLDGWRRMGANNDNLVVSMVAVSFVKQDLVLLAELLAKLPKETPLPDDCTQALRASDDAEFDLCPAMRADFQMVNTAPAMMDAGKHGWLRPSLQLDKRNYAALIAGDRARYCAAPMQALARADRKSRGALAPSPRCSRLRRLADPVGCTLGEVATVDGYDEYLDRRTDQAAALALMRTIVWLRDNANSPEEVKAALARRPASLGLRRAPRYSKDSDQLSIDLLERSHGDSFVLVAGAEPLPVLHHARPGLRRASARSVAVN